MNPHLKFVEVRPVLPEPLAGLEKLARNLLWDWTPEIRFLFHRVDPELWEASGHNPVALLGRVPQPRLDELATDVGFLSQLGRANERLDQYLASPAWFQTEHMDHASIRIGYFSAEFGLTACLPIYSGGLGVLAGDHLKSASDLGLPLVGVGLLYQEGYFRQYLNTDGWQMEMYPPNDFYNLPITLERDESGAPQTIFVEFPGRHVHAQIWRVDVGRIPLFLLDTNVEQNSPSDRQITRALYSGGTELRIQQLMILGIGGLRALAKLGREPTVCHMNEGHAGFLGVERTRHLMEREGMRYELAREIVEDGNVFTTHTPVPAGFDVFGKDLVQRYLSDYYGLVGLDLERFMALGRNHQHDPNEPLNMAVVAVRHSTRRNGVSKLHGAVSRRMLQSQGAWADWPEDEVPVGHVTNGVHTLSVVAPEMAELLDRYLPPEWRTRVSDPEVWSYVHHIPDEELWRTHVSLRMQLVSYVRKRLAWQASRRNEPPHVLDDVGRSLNPDALTIGFARRFATYKRATLLFSDLERLVGLLQDHDRPVQFIFSGKAHPADLPAKEFIKTIANTLKEEKFEHAIVFLEDYDIDVARHMVQGADVWLNNPQRPREASGTSGMKLIPNGGLNCSILDGWWAEAYEPGIGWAIGNGEDYSEDRDPIEANALYDILENEVVPTFYEGRDTRGVPRRWVKMMKQMMVRLAAEYTTDRMVKDYVDKFYIPAADHYRGRVAGDRAATEAVADWKRRIQHHWNEVWVERVEGPSIATRVGENFEVTAAVRLGALQPDDVQVQVYHGAVDALADLGQAEVTPMERVDEHDGIHNFRAQVPADHSGRHGYTVRVVPHHEEVLVPNELTNIRWAQFGG